ncbi:condensation domain-containing protein, partial [Bacillus atrophaeus]|uniref:condensation domain-containing protein n=1 Tax=Bacillus atrophaeus TaxID=1452 RepID=UPI002E1A99BA|nr:condensation domain-containing protein [Bacillus atrophaeus]
MIETNIISIKDISNFVLDKIYKETKNNTINLSSQIYDFHISSLGILRILGEIEDTYGINLEIYDYVENESLSSFCKLIFHKVNDLEEEQEKDDYFLVRDNENEEFDLTNVQMAYLSGRETAFELGNTSTHAYIELECELDIMKLQYSLNKVIERQSMLRAVIKPNGKQKILKSVPSFEIHINDISKLSSLEQKNKILYERNKASHKTFDPYVWPLFEFKALKLDSNKYRLFFGIDMLIADGASIQLLFKEISTIYNSKENSIEPLEISYKDYLLAYKKIKQSSKYQEDKRFWLNKVGNFPDPPSLPLKENLRSVEKPRFKRLKKVLDEKSWSELLKICSDNNLRPSMLFLIIYSKVLVKWSNKNDLAINTTLFNRRAIHKQVNEIIGDFTEIMIFDVCFDYSENFWNDAKRIQNNFFESLAHNTFDGIEFTREYSKINNLTNGKAVFPVVFTSMLFDEELNHLNSFGLFKDSISQTSQVYLDHQVIQLGDGVMLSWDYVSELFEENIIESMFNDYVAIIENLL